MLFDKYSATMNRGGNHVSITINYYDNLKK